MPSTIAAYTRRRILIFFLPLAASWLLMSAEGPVLQAAIARLKDMQTQLAAFGIVMSLEIAIESPVIMLLATSTALATSARNYLVLRRFVILLNLLVTVVAVFMAFSPLYAIVVRGLMGIPPDIAAAALPGMKIMILWSASIGFRRFQQDVLIHQRETKWVGYGTILRLAASGGTGITLAVLTDLPGVYIASIGLMAGVVSEAVFVALAVPYSNSVHSWFRGQLLVARRTRIIYMGMGMNLALTALLVFGGVALRTPGAQTAVIALTLSFWIEIYYLRRVLLRAGPEA